MTRAGGRFDRARLRRACAEILQAGLRAAEPGRLVAGQLTRRGRVLRLAGLEHRLGRGRLLLLAVGKAAPAMAASAERVLGDAISSGLAVATVEGSPLGRTRVLVAGHPIPDGRGLRASEQVEAFLRDTGRDDVLLVLLSGGASALLPAPATDVTLEDKALTTSLLLRAGAPIRELNTVRKHLSRLKGGGLARLAAPARIVTLALSDVVGDDPATIGSGPTAPDPTTFADALGVLESRGVADQVPPSVRRRLEAGARGDRAETPKPGDPLFRRASLRVVGSSRLSVEAAAREARAQGLRALVLTTSLEGEAREAARALVAVLRECAESGRPEPAPVAILVGGETTVSVRGRGRGGRNQELAVAAAAALHGFPRPAVVASLATDGVDGPTDAAGGVVDDASVARAAALGLPPAAVFLAESDSHAFLAALGDLIITGPTGTNVADLAALLLG
ncbi:MAG TPA: DUF4147 domain-containing protein [Vicinamibacteria bacterium]|nr:DUF4147 domain-containing protein [Vicinamibacteria bacterium]